MGAHDVRPVRAGLSPLTVVGVLLLGFGVLSLATVGWQYYGTNVHANQAFERERVALRDRWQSPGPQAAATGRPVAGETMALLRIPDLGATWEYPVVAGVEAGDLARGIGWYPTTSLPGEVGNVGLAGHRITHGEPFAHLLELKQGADVLLETRTAVYRYRLTTAPADLTVTDADTWVLDPVPGQPAKTVPTRRLLTLTTCTDLIASPTRSVAFAELVETLLK